jgi:hypothetical protein
MENRKEYQLTVDGDVSEYVQGRISGVIYGVVKSTQSAAIKVKYSKSGRWIFTRKKVESVIYTFDATQDEANEVCALITYLYGKDERRDFGFGIKLIEEEA